MPINPNTYFAPALTDLQSELTAKVGSMKSILALPNLKKRNIPKDQQISTVDYLLKIFSSLGVDPQVVFNAFLSSVFDEYGTKLEDFAIKAIADSFGQKGIQISPYLNQPLANSAQISIFKDENYKYLKNLIPNTFLQAAKQQMVKNLMIMIFGPKDGPIAEKLNPNASERDDLINNAICGLGMFSISNDPQLKNSDIEYTRIRKRQELEKGQVVYEISCQDVKISLPDNPQIFFQGGGVNSVGQTLPLTPYQSILQVNQYVVNQTQKINNEKNSNKVGKSFSQILVESLIGYMSTLMQPYLPEVFTTIQSAVEGENNLPAGSVNFPVKEFVFSMCEINNLTNSNNTEAQKTQKKEFVRSLLNSLLKDLIKLLLVFGIKVFKKFIKNYFATRAILRQKRKAEKARLKYDQIFSKVKDSKDKVEKYQAAISVLTNLLGTI
jgi:hypothetical protein